VAFLTFQTS